MVSVAEGLQPAPVDTIVQLLADVPFAAIAVFASMRTNHAQLKESHMALASRSTPIERLQFVNPEGLYDPRPNAYSHLAVFPAGWRMILPAGQGGENADGVLPPDFGSQLRQALRNTEIALAAAGAAPSAGTPHGNIVWG